MSIIAWIYTFMIRYVAPYAVSLALHLAGFFLVALLAQYRQVVQPVVIDFSVCSAHASAEQQTVSPAKPTINRTVLKQQQRPAPRQQLPTPREQIHEKNLQAVSEVAVTEAPRPVPIAQPVQTAQTAAPAATPGIQQGTGTTAQNIAATASGTGTADQAQTKYLKEQFTYIRDKIASQVRYPRQARRMGWSGIVQVSFVIEENGSLNEVRVVRSSQISMLDEEAVDSVKRSAPFPRPPTRARIVIPVEFVLN